VMLRGAGGITTDLVCGPVGARPVIVEYETDVQRSFGTSGNVKYIEFR
jgi:hypothetical protein